jgi:hypothetical protein
MDKEKEFVVWNGARYMRGTDSILRIFFCFLLVSSIRLSLFVVVDKEGREIFQKHSKAAPKGDLSSSLPSTPAHE